MHELASVQFDLLILKKQWYKKKKYWMNIARKKTKKYNIIFLKSQAPLKLNSSVCMDSSQRQTNHAMDLIRFSDFQASLSYIQKMYITMNIYVNYFVIYQT